MSEEDEQFILLAEDNRADVYLVRKALEEHGIVHELRTVKDGEEAIRFLADLGPGVPCPRLILLDLNLPKITGHELLEILRANPHCTSVPVIVLTSSDSPADREGVTSRGARAYFRKPSRLEAFMELGGLVKRVLTESEPASAH